jgi:hypothetical protein
MLDLDGSGTIELQEIETFIGWQRQDDDWQKVVKESGIYHVDSSQETMGTHMRSKRSSLMESDAYATLQRKHAKKVFDTMAKNTEGQITLAQFQQCVGERHSILRVLMPSVLKAD